MAHKETWGAQGTQIHPCFNEHACNQVRVHLPVAPRCNIQCNYCSRSYDCVNESRPGVSSAVLGPTQALDRYKAFKGQFASISVVGIAGPGDALANFDETAETLRLVRAYDPTVAFCLATNGLDLPLRVADLVSLGVSHVTVTVNAIDPRIGARIYAYIRHQGRVYTGTEGAAILQANQLEGIRMLKEAGLACKVNCVALKGINLGHISAVTKKAAQMGACVANIMPHIPVAQTLFAGLGRISHQELASLRAACKAHIPQMTHCRQCRADAAGPLGRSLSNFLDEEACAPGTCRKHDSPPLQVA
ncbi:MAG: radical SAM protein [Coriobacteriaceae bacterium]|jgi:nitrogenase cofactor biosynthesis protein NifB|nr:radical SAM protein [Coriobacteriaceae bacterium]